MIYGRNFLKITSRIILFRDMSYMKRADLYKVILIFCVGINQGFYPSNQFKVFIKGMFVNYVTENFINFIKVKLDYLRDAIYE
jgi:hypothetical protein